MLKITNKKGFFIEISILSKNDKKVFRVVHSAIFGPFLISFLISFLTIFNYLAVKKENEIKNEPKMMWKMATVNDPIEI